MPRVRRTVVALVAIASVASAQGLPDPLADDPRARPTTTGDVKMPVAGPRTGDVVGGEPGLAAPTPPIAIEQPIDPDTYICGPGDVLELDFWGQQNFRLRAVVDLEGRAFIAKVGFIAVTGKSLAAARTAIKAKVRGTYPGLQFDMTLVTPRTFVVHVVDYVKQPGSYTSRALDRVSTLLAKAGGATGSRRRIAIKHRDGSTGVADLVRYELTGDTAANPFLLDGDVITVPFASPVVSISGAVHRPGQYELVGSKDLAELLDLAGGFTPSVSRALPIRLLRRNERQQDAAIELPFAGDAAPNAALRDDDKIIVRGADELQRTVLVIGAVVGADPLDPATTSRRVPYIEGDTVLSLLDRVGGIKTPGDLQHSYVSRPRAGQTPELIPLDLEALLVRRDFHADTPIHMNDTIVVPAMRYSVLVEGAVTRSGLYNYNPTFGIPEYIGHAGGRTRTARDLEDVQLIDSNGRTHPYRAGMKPSPGDEILVPERNFSRGEIAQLVLAGVGLVLSGIAVTIAATR